jgi:hypothetical protein
MKTLKSLLHEAELKMQMWHEIAEDEQALEDRKKTKHEALYLANYFEGRVSAFTDAKYT